MRRPTIAEAALAVLTEAGPLPAAELGRRVAELGATRSKNPAAAVKQALASECRVARLVDGRFALTILALDGLVLTHRLTDEEVEEERVVLEPDLSPIAVLAADGLPLAGDGEAGRCGEGHLHGPAGWLGGATAGDLRAFRLRDGRLVVGPAEFGEIAVASAQAVLTVVQAELDRRGGRPAMLGFALRQAAVAAPTLLRDPIAPLGDLLGAVGMAVRGGMAYPPGVDPENLPAPANHRGLPLMQLPPLPGLPAVPGLPNVREALAERMVGRLAERFGVDTHAVDGLALILQAVELSIGDPESLAKLDAEQGLLGELGAILAYPGVAELARLALAAEPAAAETLFTQLAYAVGPPLSAAPIWLLARLAEARADALTAEALDLRAMSADPAFVPALLDAARSAEDRSDPHTAACYLRLAGGQDDHPHLVRLERYAEAEPRTFDDPLPDLDLDLNACGPWPEPFPPDAPADGRADGGLDALDGGRPAPTGPPAADQAAADQAAADDGTGADGEGGRTDPLRELADLTGARLDGLIGGAFGRLGIAGGPSLPLPIRATWLMDKALGWSLLPVNRPAIGHLPALLTNSPTVALVEDTILFDRGMLARYLRARAQVLPPDEFELGRDWLVTERALWSIEAAHPHGHLVLRNVRTGELAEVTEPTRRQPPERGELRYGRVIPDGRDRLLLNGGIHVPEALRAAFLTLLAHQLDGAAILAWFEEIYRDPEAPEATT